MKVLIVFALYAIGLSIGLARKGLRMDAPAQTAAPAPDPRRLLIVGATGGTGRQLVAQALERGFAVTALVRTPAKLAIDHERLTVMQGDVLDAAAVEAAVRGQDAVLCALGHPPRPFPTRILSRGTANILRAMSDCGVGRLVCETSLGIGGSAGRMGLYYTFLVIPLILPFYFWDKTRQERIIAGSGLDWIIVRPGALTNGPRRGRLRHGRGVGNFIWTVSVSRADVAAFMLDQLSSDAYLRAAPGVAGGS
jgi:putative NADH-flavin reductase